jgi:hypothetical protein
MQKIPLNLAAAEMVLAQDIFKNDSPTRYADLRQGDCAFRFTDQPFAADGGAVALR